MIAATPEQWVGSKVGKYLILRELGRGGMGEVFLAEDSLLGRRVALKRLLPIFASDEDFVARFKREARSVSSLAHPGIVTIHSLDWVNGVLLIDMEHVDGTSLLKLLQSSVVTREFTARLGYEVLAALAECHENGIVHRDIKPSNILLTDSLQAKLVDFGIATALADSTATQLREGRSTTIVLGTPRFMAPEAWDGGPVSPQWDLFALGVVLYESLTGEVAFKGTTTGALARQITNEPLPKIAGRVPNLSAPLARLVDSLVVIDPAHRCSSAREGLEMLAGAPELSASMGATTVHRSPVKVARNTWRRTGALMRAPRFANARRGAMAAFFVLIAVGLVWGAVVLRSSLSVLAPEESDPEGAATSGGKLRPATGAYVVQSLTGGSAGTWNWWISQDQPSSDTVIVGYSSLAMLRMTMLEREGQLNFSGAWAGYSNPLARGFETGSVSGIGRWQNDHRALAFTLKFEDFGSASTHDESFLAEPSPAIATESAFLYSIEAADLLPTLIYYGLQPRELPLGREIESLLPANGQRVFAPLIADSAAPVIDGLLEDETWRQPIFDRSGRVGELDAARGTNINFRQTKAGLYVAMQVAITAGSIQEAEFGVMQGVAHPPQWAKRAILSMHDATVTDRHYFDGENEVPFPDGWKMAIAASQGHWSLELFIPFDGSAEPSAPWRFNANVIETVAGGSPRVLAQWGDSDGHALHHGALITFRESTQ